MVTIQEPGNNARIGIAGSGGTAALGNGRAIVDHRLFVSVRPCSLYYGILLIIEKTFLLKVLEKTPAVLRHIYSMVAVLLGWALFYFEDMGALGAFFGRLFSFVGTGAVAVNRILGYLPLFAVSVVAATPLGKSLYCKIQGKTWSEYAMLAGSAVLMLLCVAVLVSQSYNPFIYFRF